jgi:hypothetical protein
MYKSIINRGWMKNVQHLWTKGTSINQNGNGIKARLMQII